MLALILAGSAPPAPFWGFTAHRKINYQAIFSLPPEMILFYKQHITYLTDAAVDPDRRRYAVEDEGARHYIDLDHYGDRAYFDMPHHWDQAIKRYSQDTLEAYGILPWHIQVMYYRLKEAFMLRDPQMILKNSAEIGHYLGDANVPLHTTENYDGQLTGQKGIHGFWETRLPELFMEDYDYVVGKAAYIKDTQEAAWEAVRRANILVPAVLQEERNLNQRSGGREYAFETRGQATVKVPSRRYAKAYRKALHGMVERQLRRSIKMVADFWYTAWVDAGQPDLAPLADYQPSDEELSRRLEELDQWKQRKTEDRQHEVE